MLIAWFPRNFVQCYFPPLSIFIQSEGPAFCTRTMISTHFGFISFSAARLHWFRKLKTKAEMLWGNEKGQEWYCYRLSRHICVRSIGANFSMRYIVCTCLWTRFGSNPLFCGINKRIVNPIKTGFEVSGSKEWLGPYYVWRLFLPRMEAKRLWLNELRWPKFDGSYFVKSTNQ